MNTLNALALALVLATGTAQGSEHSDAITAHLYAGTAAEGIEDATQACDIYFQEACFGLGLLTLVTAYEGLAQDFYRHGAVLPGETPASILLGVGATNEPVPANPNPEKLSYQGLRNILDNFVTKLDTASTVFENSAAAASYVVPIDPMRVRVDLDGDGTAGAGETLGTLIATASEAGLLPPPEGKSKSKIPAPDTTIGFDPADAFWFAGYSQVTAAPFDLLLAHDFSQFFDTYMHRVFPKAGLPMQEHGSGGVLFLDPSGDAGIADMIASVHTLNFPVTDRDRLAGVLDRLRSITSLSRKNWNVILSETDDNRELVPSPGQTSSLVQLPVTQEVIAAWLATLDTVDQVLAGELLVPHWRFKQGFDLKLYFETAKETDLVLLMTGSAALPYLRSGTIADAQSFSQANEVLGADWLNYAFWFN